MFRRNAARMRWRRCADSTPSPADRKGGSSANFTSR